jgi:hypothetical protein
MPTTVSSCCYGDINWTVPTIVKLDRSPCRTTHRQLAASRYRSRKAKGRGVHRDGHCTTGASASVTNSARSDWSRSPGQRSWSPPPRAGRAPWRTAPAEGQDGAHAAEPLHRAAQRHDVAGGRAASVPRRLLPPSRTTSSSSIDDRKESRPPHHGESPTQRGTPGRRPPRASSELFRRRGSGGGKAREGRRG